MSFSKKLGLVLNYIIDINGGGWRVPRFALVFSIHGDLVFGNTVSKVRDKTLANRFKKKRMRWSTKALSLAKGGEKIVNNEWNSWWAIEDDPIGPNSELEKVVPINKIILILSLSYPSLIRIGLGLKSIKRLVSIN